MLNSFEIYRQKVGLVKKQCTLLDYPLLEEYDFRNDTINDKLDIDLKPTTLIRPYQSKALSKMFGNGRARSGMIVLPCGAGKTLVGITAACTIQKSTLVICPNDLSVNQWRREFKRFSTIADSRIGCFTRLQKNIKPDACILLTTYKMLGRAGKRAKEAEKGINELRGREWGLMLLDEVHVFPANIFHQEISKIAAHTKLGLTATLLREDDKIKELEFMIGPKLYEANWLDLIRDGFLARVQCALIWCPMVPSFFSSYLNTTCHRKKKLLAIMNPNILHACQYLIHFHEARGDKILVFLDDIKPLVMLSAKFGRDCVRGDTKAAEREKLFESFKMAPGSKTLFLSKVGDEAIDLPEATVLIQVSCQYGSRRQEAQRLGRILRPKGRTTVSDDTTPIAFFYSLVSPDTREMYHATKRQEYLIDQGYSFKNITSLPFDEEFERIKFFKTPEEQAQLLQDVLKFDMPDEQDPQLQQIQQIQHQQQLKKQQQQHLKRSVSTPAVSGSSHKELTQKERFLKKLRK